MALIAAGLAVARALAAAAMIGGGIPRTDRSAVPRPGPSPGAAARGTRPCARSTSRFPFLIDGSHCKDPSYRSGPLPSISGEIRSAPEREERPPGAFGPVVSRWRRRIALALHAGVRGAPPGSGVRAPRRVLHSDLRGAHVPGSAVREARAA